MVLRIVPCQPTTVPVFASENETLFKNSVVPLVCDVQVVPPFVVLIILPDRPTAVPVFASVNETASKKFDAPVD